MKSHLSSETFALARERPRIVFVSGFPNTPSNTYRVENPAAILSEAFSVSVFSIDQVPLEINADILVLFRVAWSPALSVLVDRLRKSGSVIVYDVDDFILDPEVANEIFVDGIRFLAPQQRQLYFEGVARYQKAFDCADCGTFPTPALVRYANTRGKEAFTLLNAMSYSRLLGGFDDLAPTATCELAMPAALERISVTLGSPTAL